MKIFLTFLLALGCAVVTLRTFAGETAKAAKANAFEDGLEVRPTDRVFELRTYHAAPGKLEALQARFRDHTCKLFEKHGMTIIGFWTPDLLQPADAKLIYLLAFPSREAANKSWAAFQKDPDWKAAREASEKNGRLVNSVERVFLNPTDYSPLK